MGIRGRKEKMKGRKEKEERIGIKGTFMGAFTGKRERALQRIVKVKRRHTSPLLFPSPPSSSSEMKKIICSSSYPLIIPHMRTQP